MKIIAFIGLITLFSPDSPYLQVPAFKLSSMNVSQGDVLILRAPDAKYGKFKATFLGREYESFKFGKYQSVLIGIHYQLPKGKHFIVIRPDLSENSASFNLEFSVKELYPKLKFDPPARDPKVQERINKEVAEKREALSGMNLALDKLDYFSWSVFPIKVNSDFGKIRPDACKRRKFREKYNCKYHSGTDYRSAFDFFHQKAEPARAINSGRVIVVKENLLDGKLVVIDHGNGISSEYLHLSKFLVKEGDMVVRGQKIGITGKTGATDAIHLHLTIKMDNGKTIVDPEIFLKTLSK